MPDFEVIDGGFVAVVPQAVPVHVSNSGMVESDT